MTGALALLALLGAQSSTSSERVLLDRIVATVNDDIVTLTELKQAAGPYLARNRTPTKRAALYQDILRELVNERLLSQQVAEANIDVPESEVDAAIEDVLQQNGIDRSQLMAALQARNMDMQTYRRDIREQLVRLKLIDLKVRSRVSLPEEDIRLEYERRVRDDPAKVKVEIAHILLRFDEGAPEAEQERVLAAAAAARARVVEGGEDFGAVAQEISQGPTASSGGGLGVLEETTLMPELATAVKVLEPGEVSPPIPTRNGVHVVRLIDRQLERARSLEDMRAVIYQDLYRERVEQEMSKWLDELRAKSTVETRLDGDS